MKVELTLPARHVGILACSAEGAALCYRTICAEAPAILGRHMHPELTMHTYPLGAYMRKIEEEDDWAGVAELMLSSIRKLEASGAEIIVCPDNTIHQAYETVSPAVESRWLHIAEGVASKARERGFRRLGVLGTRFLMEGPVYRSRLEPLGIESRIPEKDDRERINEIIFDELVEGIFKSTSLDVFLTVIKKLAEAGCDAVVLGCTEIPLIIDQSVSPLPTLDSTRLLARAAIEASIAERCAGR